MGRFSDHKVQEFLESFDHTYLALHFDNPDVAGAYASELFGGGYERQKVEFGAVTGRGISVITSALFAGLPSVTITHLCGWDAKTNGNLDFLIEIEPPVRTKEGGTYSVPANSVVLSFD